MNTSSQSNKVVILGGLLSSIPVAIAACGDRDIKTLNTVPPPEAFAPQAVAETQSSNSSSGDRVELIFGSDPDVVMTSDAAIAHALLNLPDNSDLATVTSAASSILGESVETPSELPLRDIIDGFTAPVDLVSLSDVAVLLAASTQASEDLFEDNLVAVSNNLLGSGAIDEIFEIPGTGDVKLPVGAVGSTEGGSGFVTTSAAGGWLSTATDIDTLLENLPDSSIAPLILPPPEPGTFLSLSLETPIRLPNGSGSSEENFYILDIFLDLERDVPRDPDQEAVADAPETVAEVCFPSPVEPGETCNFKDDFAAAGGGFELEFTFTDGAGIEYTSTREVFIEISTDAQQ